MTLQSRQLALASGSRLLFDHLDFEVAPGEALHVAGRNGSGKTSLLRVLCGLAPPLHGELLWRGHPHADQIPHIRQTLVYIGHASGLKDDLTLGENLRIASSLAGRACSRNDARQALRQLELADRLDAPVRTLSQGQRKRAALARLALSCTSRLIVLDEPFNALDHESTALLTRLLNAHLGTGAILVYTTHQAAPMLGARTHQVPLGVRAASPNAVPTESICHEPETC